MGQRSERIRDLLFEDLKAHPEIVTDLLSEKDEVSVLLRRSGDRVRFAATRTYPKEAVELLAEARSEYAEKKRSGYSREDAVADFESFQAELAKRMK
jgi:hypothetical protein